MCKYTPVFCLLDWMGVRFLLWGILAFLGRGHSRVWQGCVLSPPSLLSWESVGEETQQAWSFRKWLCEIKLQPMMQLTAGWRLLAIGMGRCCIMCLFMKIVPGRWWLSWVITSLIVWPLRNWSLFCWWDGCSLTQWEFSQTIGISCRTWG